MIKVTKQMLDALKQLTQRLSKTDIMGTGSTTITIYGSEFAALIAAIIALDK